VFEDPPQQMQLFFITGAVVAHKEMQPHLEAPCPGKFPIHGLRDESGSISTVEHDHPLSPSSLCFIRIVQCKFEITSISISYCSRAARMDVYEELGLPPLAQ
jgi:hypothetical protein